MRHIAPGRGPLALIVAVILAMVAASTARATTISDELNLDAKLGGIGGIVIVVDVAPEGLAALKLDESIVRTHVRSPLQAAGVHVLTEDEALKSRRGVAVLHVVVNAVVDEDSRMSAVKVDVECLRSAVIDRRKYAPMVIVWRTGGIGLHRISAAQERTLKALDDHVRKFVSLYTVAAGTRPQP